MGVATWAVAAVLAGLLSAGLAGAATLPPIVESQPISSQSPSSPASGPPGAAAAARPQSLEERVTRIERQIDSQALVEMYSRIDNLQQQLQELRGMIDEQTHGAQGIEQRQRELYLDFDRRIRQIETQLSELQQSPTAAAPSPDAAAADIPPAVGPQDKAEQAAYQQAVDTLKAGRNQEAITALKDFLQRNPDSQYAANAQYWLGEANYVMKRYPDAVAEFDKVVKAYPDSGKVPDAMLKIGYSQYELGQFDKAGATLNSIIDKFPKSTAAQLAQSRLQRMKNR
jgi:tol-pal system protein YbgF